MQHSLTRAESEGAGRGWRPVASAFSAVLVGIGLARFAYTPLIPALIAAHWFTAGAVLYLGAANLSGYLAGAMLGRTMAARFSTTAVLRAMMVLATATFFACANPIDFAWFLSWRFISGLAGGALMVLAAPAVLPGIAPERRGLAVGVIFAGVGLGIAASGTLVPLLLRGGLGLTWLGLGGLALLLTAGAWRGWPEPQAREPVPASAAARRRPAALTALYMEYGLNAVGLVPHMLFLVDFVVRGLGRGMGVGADAWIVFGCGALAGPVLAGYLADRAGFRRALRIGFLIQAASVVLLAAPAGLIGIFASSLIVGAFVPGIAPLVLGRIHELTARPRDRQAAWSIATVAFALGQAVAAYGFSFLLTRSGDYALLYALGAAALLSAFAIDLRATGIGTAEPARKKTACRSET